MTTSTIKITVTRTTGKKCQQKATAILGTLRAITAATRKKIATGVATEERQQKEQ